MANTVYWKFTIVLCIFFDVADEVWLVRVKFDDKSQELRESFCAYEFLLVYFVRENVKTKHNFFYKRLNILFATYKSNYP